MSETPIGGAASAGAIKASIDFDAAGLEAAVDKAMRRATGRMEAALDESTDRMENTVRSSFKRFGAGLLGFLGVGQLTDVVRQAGSFVLNIGREVESALNNFRAISGATADQMEQVGETAKALGNDISLPGTSAADAAVAMTELAKAGFTVEESMAAAKGTLQLATAAQIDAGRAAEISSKQLQAFGLEVSDAGFVADVLANAANETSADMEGMADSLNQVGSVAHASGLSFTETSAAVALMADNAIIGSDAGTSLKAMLLALQAPSNKAATLMEELGINVYNADGSMKSLTEITGVLDRAFVGATDKQRQFALATIFGADAIRAVNVLMNQGASGMREMTTRMEQQGSAAKLAAANSRGLVGALAGVQNTAESLAITIYQKAAPAVDAWLRGRLEELPDLLSDIGTYLTNVGNAIEPAAELFYDLARAAAPGVMIAFKAALGAVLGVLQGIGLILKPIVALINSNEDAFRKLVTALTAAYVAFKLMNGVAGQVKTWRTDAVERYGARVDKVRTSLRSAAGAANLFRSAGAGLVGALGGPWGIALAAGATAFGVLASKSAEAKAHIDELTDSLDENTGAVTENTRAIFIKALEDSGVIKKAQELGVNLDLVTAAVLGEKDALAELEAGLYDVQEAHRLAAEVRGGGNDEEREKYADLVAAVKEEADALDSAKAANDRMAAASRAATRAKIQQIGAEQSAAEAAAAIRGSSVQTIEAEKRLMAQTHDTSSALDRQSRSAERATRAIKGLKDETISAIEGEIAFEEAADNLRGVIKKLTPEQIKNGRALDTQFEVGRKVYRAFIDLANSSAEVEGGMDAAREQILNTIAPMVGSRAEARRLTNQFFELQQKAEDVPDNVHVDVQADVSEAMRKIGQVQFKLQELDGNRYTTYVNTVFTQSGKRFKDVGGGSVPGNAHGGPIFGEGTGTSDSNLRRLSRNEHVLTAEEVRLAGGHAGVFALRAAIRRGDLSAMAENGSAAALVDNLSISVGEAEDLPEAWGQAMFHLRRLRRGSRYN